MGYCLLFTQSKSLLYDLYSDQWRRYMNIPLLDGRRETYCLNVAGGAMTGTDAARLAGYCTKNPKNARVMSWYLLKRPDVQDRIAQLREAASDEAIMTLVQQKIVLSEIARARLSDYQDEHGIIRPLEGDVPNPAAIESVEYRWNPIKKEAYPWRIKLRDPVAAIAELCKLDNSYRNKKPSASVSVAPITSAAMVEDARTKLAAILNKLSVRIEEKKGTALLGNAEQEGTSEKTSR